MKIPAILAFISLSFSAFSQQPYWQQQVNYDIRVSLDDKRHALNGHATIDYTNNSPDTLSFIWFHLWPNAYKNDNTAFAKQLLKDREGRKRLNSIKDRGYIDSLRFTTNGEVLKIETDGENIDVVKVLLSKPLLPGEKVSIATPFYTKLSNYNSRSGYDDQSYMVCQWYPKPAVYDRKGWHPMSYLDQGEFYSEFGSFNVSITVPSTYIVGATGQLQNENELRQYRAMGLANVEAKSAKNKIKYKPTSLSKTLTFKGDSIHDFAWFANKDFVVRYDTLQSPSGRIVDIFTFHHPDGNKHWMKSTDYVESAVRSYSSYLGEYAYPVAQAVEGPKNEMSGGMEYPMITLITSPTADGEALDAVITHEVGHNWLYGMLASNERQHAWMDEGINSYLQFRYEAEKYRSNMIFGSSLPREMKERNAEDFQALVYNSLYKIPMDEPIETHSADFKDKESYGLVSYVKTAVWLYFLEVQFGREKVDRALQSYFQQWKFKHPYPEDFRAAFEKEMGRDLGEYFDLLKKKGSL